ncbi:MAG: hypothetical protein M1817_003051 [Caeruleum heppii]|nr:MAG: hypothetical protein M1817_003051 [Caeruleum heppii]
MSPLLISLSWAKTTTFRGSKAAVSHKSESFVNWAFSRSCGRSAYHVSAATRSTDANAQDRFRAKDPAEAIGEEKEKQARTPWHREGTDVPPVARQRSAGAMTKGKLLTTPSRLLKLILPLTTDDKNSDRKDVEPLALLVHPQQPLSYLERLIQSELPTVHDDKGRGKIPAVHFRAEDSAQDEEDSLVPKPDKHARDTEDSLEEINFEGETQKTGKLNPSRPNNLRGGPGEGGVESYSGLGKDQASEDSTGRKKFVRWSSSTEVGDFIRDAARGKEFAVEIEGSPKHIYVGVPSFNDRTHYLRRRLRKSSKRIAEMADLKKECDTLAHKGAQRVAMGGFGILVGWWYIVYRLTFETELGWDTMEPVTYLVGLSTIMGGYLWFLYHNREVSYKSALNITISRRQNKLYQARGFDLSAWESLVEEANSLRKEIKAVAREYDVDWDEKVDEQDDRVTEALEEHRDKKQKKDGESSKAKNKKRDDEDE